MSSTILLRAIVWPLMAAFVLFAVCLDPAVAQEERRGDRDRGGERGGWGRGGRDRDRNRDRDRDRGDRGDGGDRRRGDSDRRAEWMRSMDRNGDGRLDMNEIPEQFRERFAERLKQAGFDTSRPIPIDTYLERRQEQERRERQGLDPSNPTAFRGDLQPGEAPGFDQPLTAEELVMLNPEMRREILLERADPSVIGTGEIIPRDDGTMTAEEKERTERVDQMVKGTMERFDRDKNGVIEGDEMNGWMRNLDSNSDGKVTVDEVKAGMARFQQRGGGRGGEGGRGRGDENRGDRGGDDGNRWNRGGGDRGDWGRGGRGGGDWGRGGRGEWRGPGGGEEGENAGRGGRRGDFGGRDRGDRGDNQEGEQQRDGEKAEEEEQTRRSYRFTPAQDLLSEAARAVIVPKDKNGNGQIEMSEFSSTWNASKLREFDALDTDGDGVITGADIDANPPKRPSFRDRRRGDSAPAQGEDEARSEASGDDDDS